MSKIDISVVIPVKNGQKYLDSALKAIFSQKTNAKFEVIIVDSGSQDKTIDIAKNYPVNIYHIEEKNFNHGFTRNYGISKTQGEYSILMTADAIPYNESWMEKLIGNLTRDEYVAGTYSRQIPHKDSSPLTQMRVNRFFTSSGERRESQIIDIKAYNKLFPKNKHLFCNFDNVSSCIRKSVWKEIPFPKTDFAEDLEWAKSVLEAGHKIVYEPDSIVYHSHDFSPSDWYRKNMLNYRKLYSLFGAVNNIDHIHALLINFIFYTLRDSYFLCKEQRSFKVIASNIHLIPAYSFSTVLAQYRSTKFYRQSISP
jgi:rhamnosyltransferase